MKNDFVICEVKDIEDSKNNLKKFSESQNPEVEMLNNNKLIHILKMAERILKDNDMGDDIRNHPIYGLIKALINSQLYDLIRCLCEGEEVDKINCIYQDLGIWIDGLNVDQYVESIEGTKNKLHIDLSKDVVIMCAWNSARLINTLSNIGTNVGNPFLFDNLNHMVSYIHPLGIAIVYNGNHSILSGILKSEGTIYPVEVYDITEIYQWVYFDGTYYRDKKTNCIIQKVDRFELGAVFEIGRLIADRKRKQK